MAIFSGKNARVTVGVTDLCMVKWTINGKVDELDVTCFESGGYAEYQGGFQEADINFEGFWELDDHANPPNIMPNTFNALTIFMDRINAGAGVSFFTSDFFISTVTVDAEARGMVKITVSGKASGQFNYPGPDIPDHTT